MSSVDVRSAIAYHPDFLRYDFGAYHPLRPERVRAGLDLLDTAGVWDRETETLEPAPASTRDLEAVHSREYIRGVEEASADPASGNGFAEFGFVTTDNPPFPDMHYASSLITGGTIQAVHEIISGSLDHAFNPAGGLHHALRSRASGFCIYNDPAAGCAVAVRDYGTRVLYIDLDCHHGDGVQWIFYDRPDVCTVSFHESGRFLFPGTGEIEERGSGAGEGFSFNVPFLPFSVDASWLEALERLLPAIAEWYRPDLIMTNHGCDTHLWDPLTHLELTTESLAAQAKLVHQLAHDYCDGRWMAVGGGGYEWRRVVPRSWAIVWAEMTGRELPRNLPDTWVARWFREGHSEGAGPADPSNAVFDQLERRAPSEQTLEIERENRETIAAMAQQIASSRGIYLTGDRREVT